MVLWVNIKIDTCTPNPDFTDFHPRKYPQYMVLWVNIKIDTCTPNPDFTDFHPRKYQLSNSQTTQNQLSKTRNRQSTTVIQVQFKYRKSCSFFKIAKSCQIITLVCFIIFKQPMNFLKVKYTSVNSILL